MTNRSTKTSSSREAAEAGHDPDPRRLLEHEDVHFFAGVFFGAALAEGFADALDVVAADAVVVGAADAVVVGVDAVVAVDAGVDDVSVGIADDDEPVGIAESVVGGVGGFGGSPPHAAAINEAAARVTNGMTNGRELVRRAAFFMRASLYAAATFGEHDAHFVKRFVRPA